MTLSEIESGETKKRLSQQNTIFGFRKKRRMKYIGIQLLIYLILLFWGHYFYGQKKQRNIVHTTKDQGHRGLYVFAPGPCNLEDVSAAESKCASLWADKTSCSDTTEYYQCIQEYAFPCYEHYNLACTEDVESVCEKTEVMPGIDCVCRSPQLYFEDIFFQQPYCMHYKASSPSKKAAVVLHVIGIFYTFLGLSVVCDEYFCSALEVMVEYFQVKHDVAGATFMAAGGSAPELFASLMGVFFSESDVGFGTIVGSAVFNVLFVIGLCGAFAREVLTLTWWPLFRDCSYYLVSLCVLTIFSMDQAVHWYEALILFCMYLCYVAMMRWNGKLEAFFTRLFFKKEVDKDKMKTVQVVPTPPTVVVDHETGDIETRANQSIAESEVNLNPLVAAAAVRATCTENICNGTLSLEDLEDGAADAYEKVKRKERARRNLVKFKTVSKMVIAHQTTRRNLREQMVEHALNKDQGVSGEDDDDESPFDWPEGRLQQFMFLTTLPIVGLLYYAIPQCANPKYRKFFMLTFGLSLIWIALFSFMLVWWATIWGAVIGISDIVMGLTFLAAGTSIPDAISSVVMARIGQGDMAVSSSIGSNIFDILFGLPVPWFLYTAVVTPLKTGGFGTITIESSYIGIHILLLMGMVFLTISSIILRKWKLDKILGLIMAAFYGVFLACALTLEIRQPKSLRSN